MKKSKSNYFETKIHLFQEEAVHFIASYLPYLLKYIGIKRHPSDKEFFKLKLIQFLDEAGAELELSKHLGVRKFMISSNLFIYLSIYLYDNILYIVLFYIH